MNDGTNPNRVTGGVNEARKLDAAKAAAQAWFSVVELEPLGQGHIHQTYRLTDASQPDGSYVLQQVNDVVYRDIDLLTAQTQLVLGALANDADYIGLYRVPELVPTKRGLPLLRLAIEGRTTCWRMWRFVEGSTTFDPPQTPQQIELAGQAFGAYQRALEGLRPAELKHTIPNFLHMSEYLAQFDTVLAKAEPAEITQAQPWIDLVQDHRQWTPELAVPNALIHGDCKINNALFDTAGSRVLAIIDLDNNMHGHWAWDFGDLVRSVAFSRGGFDPDDYQACVTGFRAGKGSQDLGAGCLVSAPAYLSYMLGLRFLTDHLDGDRYFSVPNHGDNLGRAKEQFALFQQFQAHGPTMAAIVARTDG